MPSDAPRSDATGDDLASKLKKGVVQNVDDFVQQQEDEKVKEKRAKKGFMKLGYGTVAFFNFQEYMLILFLLLVLIVAPNFWMFNEFDGGDRKPQSWTFRASIA